MLVILLCHHPFLPLSVRLCPQKPTSLYSNTMFTCLLTSGWVWPMGGSKRFRVGEERSGYLFPPPLLPGLGFTVLSSEPVISSFWQLRLHSYGFTLFLVSGHTGPSPPLFRTRGRGEGVLLGVILGALPSLVSYLRQAQTSISTSSPGLSSVNPLSAPIWTRYTGGKCSGILHACKDRFGLEMHRVQGCGDRKQKFSKWVISVITREQILPPSPGYRRASQISWFQETQKELEKRVSQKEPHICC